MERSVLCEIIPPRHPCWRQRARQVSRPPPRPMLGAAAALVLAASIACAPSAPAPAAPAAPPASGQPNAVSAPSSPPPASLTYAATTLGWNLVPTIIGQEKGFYAAEGLTVETVIT